MNKGKSPTSRGGPLPTFCHIETLRQNDRPGEWILFKVTLKGAGGYQLNRPGDYHVVLLGSELRLPDSTELTLTIEP